jgi:hypothetical protein
MLVFASKTQHAYIIKYRARKIGWIYKQVHMMRNRLYAATPEHLADSAIVHKRKSKASANPPLNPTPTVSGLATGREAACPPSQAQQACRYIRINGK